MSQSLVVGISDLKIAKTPDTLITYALGSCVGICIYDKGKQVGGLSHILLPESTVSMDSVNILKFADTSIPKLINSLEKAGATRAGMTAKIVGGAQMFQNIANSQIGQIGQRNVQAVKATLSKERIRIIAEDTGSNYGRTVMFNLSTGEVTVKAAFGNIKVI